MDRMRQLTASMRRQLLDQRRGELVREGVKIAIVGPPNAGKSSLFNLLAARDAAIVSAQAGTTRDVLEVSLNLGGVKCVLQDTAGVRRAAPDLVEREGMKRAVQAAARADLVVAVVDGATTTGVHGGLEILESVLEHSGNSGDDNDDDDEEENNVELISRKHVLLVMNKADLQQQSQQAEAGESEATTTTSPLLRDRIGGTFRISCVTQEGIDAFLDDLTNRVSERVGDVEEIATATASCRRTKVP